MEEEDCCQQSGEEFCKNFLHESIIVYDQPCGCCLNDNAQDHVDGILPFNHTTIEYWAKIRIAGTNAQLGFAHVKNTTLKSIPVS